MAGFEVEDLSAPVLRRIARDCEYVPTNEVVELQNGRFAHINYVEKMLVEADNVIELLVAVEAAKREYGYEIEVKALALLYAKVFTS